MASSSNAFVSTIGWFFIPNLVTSFIQNAYYTIITRSPVSQNNPRYYKHRRSIYIAVIGVYLLYSIIDAYWSVVNEGGPRTGKNQGLYTILGVDTNSTLQQIRTAYRKLSVQFHPDKTVGGGVSSAHESDDINLWLTIKSSYEVLSDPILRFAYDRFGVQVVSWKSSAATAAATAAETGGGLLTTGDFISQGLKQSIFSYYILSLGSLLALNIVGIGQQGQHWRYYILVVALLTEVTMVTRQQPIDIFPGLHLLPFQAILLLRRLLISIFVGINQIAPLFQPPPANNHILNSGLDRLEKLSQEIQQESSNSLLFEYAPFQDGMETVKTRLVEQMLELQLRSDPEVVYAVKLAQEQSQNLDK